MEQILDFLKSFNAPTLLGIGLIMWYFSRHIEAKIDSLQKETKASLAAQTARTDRLYEMFIELVKKQD